MVKKRSPGMSPGELLIEVSYCGRYFHDLAMLELSGIASLPVIETLAEGSRKMFARGQVVRALFERCAEIVLARLPAGDRRSERVAVTIGAWLQGESIASVARAHKRTRSYWSRTYRRQAAELMAVELMRELEALRLQQVQARNAAKVAQVAGNQGQVVL